MKLRSLLPWPERESLMEHLTYEHSHDAAFQADAVDLDATHHYDHHFFPSAWGHRHG